MTKFINDWILKLAPFLAPLPTAYVIYGKLQTVLGWNQWISLIAAAVIEMIGFRSVGLAVSMYQFNRTCSAVEIKLRAPLWQAISAVLLYAVAVISLTILMEILPSLSLWSPIAFVIMGLTGGWLAALTTDQDEREKARVDARAKALLARKQSKSDKQDLLASKQGEQVAGASDKQADKLQVQVARKADKFPPQARKQVSKQPVQDEALLAHWRDHPQASDQQVADSFGKSRQAIQQRREKLIRQGAIRMTDNGVEIVGISVSMQTTEKTK